MLKLHTDSTPSISNQFGNPSDTSYRSVMKRILSLPDAAETIVKIPPPELYYLIKGVGLQDAAELIEFASSEQFVFCLDIDIWEKWSPCADYLYEWLEVMLEGGEERVVHKIRGIDPELIILMLKKEIKVSGGVQVFDNPEEFQTEWDYTLDNLYYLFFLNKEHSQVISKFLEVIMIHDNQLYVSFLDGVIASSEYELQEESYQFRTARLADFGFPDYESALSVCSYVDPGSAVAKFQQNVFDAEVYDYLPVPLPKDDLFVSLIRGDSQRYSELMILFNNVIVAEGKHPEDADEISGLFRRVCGIMTIALEYRCGCDMDKCSDLLKSSPLANIFRIGFSVILQLKHKAQKGISEDIQGNLAYRRVIEGLLKRIPLFYKGFDDDLLDDYREFRTLDDVNKVRKLLDAS